MIYFERKIEWNGWEIVLGCDGARGSLQFEGYEAMLAAVRCGCNAIELQLLRVNRNHSNFDVVHSQVLPQLQYCSHITWCIPQFETMELLIEKYIFFYEGIQYYLHRLSLWHNLNKLLTNYLQEKKMKRIKEVNQIKFLTYIKINLRKSQIREQMKKLRCISFFLISVYCLLRNLSKLTLYLSLSNHTGNLFKENQSI